MTSRTSATRSPMIVFDVLFRLLRHRYGADHVTYVRNITDVDDKINARAAEEFPGLPLNEAIRKVTEKTEMQFHEDVAALGCLLPTVEPRATDHIAEMRALIDKLVASGNAYVAEDNVLFSVPSMKDYGQLSKRPLDELIAGARIEVAPYKRCARFCAVEAVEAGRAIVAVSGRHRGAGASRLAHRCSAMSWKYLGEMFDIHGGGIDLVFPHHEDEIAQSRCAFHTPVMANYWMHNGFLQVEGEKMSKSLGNFVTINQLLQTRDFGGKRWSGDVVRLAMLKTHYRQPIDWTTKTLEEAENTLRRFSGGSALAELMDLQRESFDPPLPTQGPSAGLIAALGDDLNTPEAMAYLHETHHAYQSQTSTNVAKTDAAVRLWQDVNFLGIDLAAFREEHDARKFSDAMTNARVGSLVEERNAARKAKDFKESDRIRDELAKMGVVLKDTKDGTTWEIAR